MVPTAGNQRPIKLSRGMATPESVSHRWARLDPSFVRLGRLVRLCPSVAVASDGRPPLHRLGGHRPGRLLSPLLSEPTPTLPGRHSAKPGHALRPGEST
jgi:hypothetical protein